MGMLVNFSQYVLWHSTSLHLTKAPLSLQKLDCFLIFKQRATFGCLLSPGAINLRKKQNLL